MERIIITQILQLIRLHKARMLQKFTEKFHKPGSVKNILKARKLEKLTEKFHKPGSVKNILKARKLQKFTEKFHKPGSVKNILRVRIVGQRIVACSTDPQHLLELYLVEKWSQI